MRANRAIATLATVLLAVATATAGCEPPGPAGPDGGPGVSGTIKVFAATSLTEAFTRIGRDFQAANRTTTVTFTFADSPSLAAQIDGGAAADVFAADGPAVMATVADRADAAPEVFARNNLVIAVSNGNPKAIAGLSDLARPGLKVTLCAEQVPCGDAAKRALAEAGVTLTPATREPDSRAALAAVTLGRADAALVYRTDAQANPSDVDAVFISETLQGVNDYPIVVLRDAPNAAGARAFRAYVLGPGRAVLDAAGFRDP